MKNKERVRPEFVAAIDFVRKAAPNEWRSIMAAAHEREAHATRRAMRLLRKRGEEHRVQLLQRELLGIERAWQAYDLRAVQIDRARQAHIAAMGKW